MMGILSFSIHPFVYYVYLRRLAREYRAPVLESKTSSKRLLGDHVKHTLREEEEEEDIQ